jgi:hypothetical protein
MGDQQKKWNEWLSADVDPRKYHRLGWALCIWMLPGIAINITVDHMDLESDIWFSLLTLLLSYLAYNSVSI